MSRFTGKDAANLKEAYASIYAYKPEWVINEETDKAVLVLDEESGDYITEDFLNEQADLFIDKLIEEEFDFEKTTLDELSQKFIDYSLNEGWAQNLGAKVRGGINRAATGVKNAVGGAVNRAKDRIGAAAQGLVGKRTTSSDLISRGANFATRAATSGIRATGDFAKGLVTGKAGPSGPQKNIGTDIAGGLKKLGSTVNKVSGGAGAAAGGAAGALGAKVGSAGAKVGSAGGNLVGKKVEAQPGQPPTAVGNTKAAAPATQKKPKMSRIEKRNREIFGDAHVDKLKAKNADFQAAKKTGSLDDFAKKYPDSQTAQKRGIKPNNSTVSGATNAPAPKTAGAAGGAVGAATKSSTPTKSSAPTPTRRGGNTVGDVAAAASPSGVNRTQSVVRSGNKTTTTTRTSADSSTPEGQKAVNAAKAEMARRRAARRGTPVNQNNSFDWEDQELVEQAALEMFVTIATSMIYEGHTTQDVVKFVQEHDNFDIVEVVEKVLYDEETITENTVSEEFINEQLEQLNEVVGALLRFGGALFKGARFAKGAKGLAPIARIAGSMKGGGTALSRIASQGIGKSSVVRSGLAKTATSLKGLTSKIPSSVKSFAKTAGSGLVGGVVGAKLAGGKKGDTIHIHNYGSSAGTATPGQAPPPKAKTKPEDEYKSNYLKMTTPASSSESGAKRHPVSGNKGPKDAVSGSGTAKDPWISNVKKNYVKNSYEPQPFDIVMEHLLSTEQAENADEALYIMTEMDSDAIKAIIDKK